MIRKNGNEQAKLCAKNTCIIVYGDTARLVNTIVGVAALIIAASLIAKALK